MSKTNKECVKTTLTTTAPPPKTSVVKDTPKTKPKIN